MHTCQVCGKSRSAQAKLCPGCRRLIDRPDFRGKPNKAARLTALKRSFRLSHFYCHYTGWRLSISDRLSPFYLTWDHRTPGDESDVVVAAAMINRVKSALTEDELQSLVLSLAKRFSNPKATIPRVRPKHWRRTAPVAKVVAEVISGAARNH